MLDVKIVACFSNESLVVFKLVVTDGVGDVGLVVEFAEVHGDHIIAR
jgi:hypothetical protein